MLSESNKIFAENLWDQLRLQVCVTGLKARQIVTLNKADFLIALEKGLADRNIVDSKEQNDTVET